jgi:hypothetical protein
MASNPAASLKAISSAHAEKATAAAGDNHKGNGDDNDDDMKKADPEDVRGRKLHYNTGYNMHQSRKLLLGLA